MSLSCLIIFLAACVSSGFGLSCYSRLSASYSNGISVACNATTTTCYSYTEKHSFWSNAVYSGGCGTCDTTVPGDCRMCTSDLCNTVGPSSITCFSSSDVWGRSLNISCGPGITTCYSTRNNIDMVGGCGNCSTDTIGSCHVCNTDLCNAMSPSNVGCYVYNKTNPVCQLVLCNKGVTSCSLTVNQQYLFGDCGVCDKTNLALGCKSCNTSYCNLAGSQSFATSQTDAAAVVNTNAVTAATGTSGTIRCYSRTGDTIGSNGASLTCPSGVSTCYSYASGSKSFAGCGICNTQSDPYCAVCTTDLCNAVSFSCYVRASLLVKSNGSLTSCPAGVASCYSFSSGSANFAGCGNCGSVSGGDGGCTACSSSLCNGLSSSISCYASAGDSAYSARRKVGCGASSCFEYSYGSGLNQFFFAGCGDCPETAKQSRCRTCYSDYCNSASAGGLISDGLLAAAAALLLLARVR